MINEDYVTVLETLNLGNIAIAKSLLDDANIDYVVQNENFGSIYNCFYTVSGFIRIQVRQPDEQVALQLLAELQDEPEASEIEP
jgi:hypothetical protein